MDQNVLLVVLILLSAAFNLLYSIRYYLTLKEVRKLNTELDGFRNAANRPRSNEVSLDEFLTDIQRYGFSFTRVDPAAVMLHRPGRQG